MADLVFVGCLASDGILLGGCESSFEGLVSWSIDFNFKPPDLEVDAFGGGSKKLLVGSMLNSFMLAWTLFLEG